MSYIEEINKKENFINRYNTIENFLDSLYMDILEELDSCEVNKESTLEEMFTSFSKKDVVLLEETLITLKEKYENLIKNELPKLRILDNEFLDISISKNLENLEKIFKEAEIDRKNIPEQDFSMEF